MVEQDKTRADFVAGLREIAGWLEAHPEVPLPSIGSYPYEGAGYEPTLRAYAAHVRDGRTKREVIRAVAKAMGRANKGVAIGANANFVVHRKFGSIHFVVEADRQEVCERIVVGTHEVKEEVPDPIALAAVPKVTVTKLVEEVEWRCGLVLADELAATS